MKGWRRDRGWAQLLTAKAVYVLRRSNEVRGAFLHSDMPDDVQRGNQQGQGAERTSGRVSQGAERTATIAVLTPKPRNEEKTLAWWLGASPSF